MKKMNDSHETKLSATFLLLSVAESDEILEPRELDTIADILKDFFSITAHKADELINEAQNEMKNATSLFEFGQHLNSVFDHTDRLDFISCVFEVAFADGDLHYLEHHTVKKIANILNVSRRDILTSKGEIENFLD